MSKIEWTDATWNPTVGCTRVSAGCDNCYAVRHTQRLAGTLPIYRGLVNAGKRHFNGTVRCLPERLSIPLGWRKPRRVFVNSMSDLFHETVPDEFIDEVFAVMAIAGRHTYQVLTKRPERLSRWASTDDRAQRLIDASFRLERRGLIEPFMRDGSGSWYPLPNVWLGTSCEYQAEFNQRAHWLAKTPAAVRFFSMEPLLGPIRWSGHTVSIPWAGGEARGGRNYSMLRDFIDWVIVGGESGPGARPCNIDWVRDIVAQCRAAGVRAFVKQLGAQPVWTWLPVDMCERLRLSDRKGGSPDEWPTDLRVREYP